MHHLVLQGFPVRPQFQIGVISSVLHYHYTPNFSFAGEYHADWEWVYIDMGEAVITLNTKEFVLQAGQAYLHAPNVPHKIRANACDCSVLIVAFRLAYGSEVLLPLTEAPYRLSKQEKPLVLNILDHAAANPYETDFFVDAPPPPPEDSALHLLANSLESLFLFALTPTAKEAQPDKKAPDPRIESVIAYLQENLAAQISLEQVARVFGYSQPYLSRSFRSATGMSVTEYLINLRVNHAKKLMVGGAHTMAQIAEMCGFSSVQYFSKVFKEKTGFPPNRYSKSLTIHNLYVPNPLK